MNDSSPPAPNINDRRTTQTAGKIEKISLKNVQCHSHLIVELNECTNLIQGKNGSGKSSIVAAIIAGFGGSSHMAEKGRSFKNLIQTGKQTATIEIILSNEGVNSFKKDLFGDKIIVERKIHLSGGGSYKLKDRSGHVISQKKEELVRLLCRFNIMVNNPVVILSQETAKTFLSNATPANLFKFYMLSTGMQQLKDDYEQLMGKINYCNSLIDVKLQNLQTLAKDVKEWERKSQAIQSLEKKRRKVTYLKIEKCVAEVNELTAELHNMKQAESKIVTRLGKIKAKIKLLEGEKKEVSLEKNKLEEGSINIALKANDERREKDKIESELTTKKTSHKQLINELKIIEKDAKQKRNDVNSIRQSLSKDNSVAHRLWSEKNAKLGQEKINLENKLLEIKQAHDVAIIHSQKLLNTTELDADCEHTKLEYQALNRRYNNQLRELKNCDTNRNNSLLVFSPAMPQIVDDIEKANRNRVFRNKPVGPIGCHINCIEQDWVHIAEKILMPIIKGFVVSCKDDFTNLKKIFAKRISGGSQPKIIVTRFREQVHEVYRFIVKSQVHQSLWGILEINNIHAANIVLDQLGVEGILLIPTSQEAGELLMDARRVPQNCRKAFTMHGDLYFPDPKFRIYSGTGSRQVRFLQVTAKEKIKELNESLEQTRIACIQSKQELAEKMERKKIIEEEYKQNMGKQMKYRAAMLKLEKTISDLKDKEELPPPDVFQLQTDLKERISQLEEVESKMQDMENEVGTLKEDVQEIGERYKAAAASTDECIRNVHVLRSSLESNANRHQKIMSDLKILQKKETEQHQLVENQYSTNINELEVNIRNKKTTLQESDNMEVETERQLNEIERELNSLINAIEAEESKVGDLNAIIAASEEKSANYKRIKAEVRDQQRYIKTLNSAMPARQTFIDVMEHFNAAYIKSCFKTAIAKRNLKGDLMIDHTKQLLTISVQKCGEGALSVMRPLTMMSGGEKSFATVSFILALWDVINSPIRILDEFDVFMDDVARKQVTDLMLSSIREEFQYLFITPLDYSRKASQFNTITLKPPRED